MRYVLLVLLLVLLCAMIWFVRKQKGLLKEFWLFLKAEKAWWITPIVIVLLLVAVLLVAGQAAPWLPFIYPIF